MNMTTNMLTKNHFRKLAEVVRKTTLAGSTDRRIAYHLLGTMCEEDNPQFNWDKFHAACNADINEELTL